MNDEQIRLQICFLISSEQANLSNNFVIWRTLDGVTEIEPTGKTQFPPHLQRALKHTVHKLNPELPNLRSIVGRRYFLNCERRLQLSGSISTTVFEYQEEA